MDSPLTCLIVGETPATQFLAWRLSLSNAFIILVSSTTSSDGIVSWKSSKLGSSFYRPNVFAKELQDLEPQLVDSEKNRKYKIDAIIVSCLSLPSLDRCCQVLSNYSDKDTVVLMNANFAVELENMAIDRFADCSCGVVSILCDVEARQLSSGSYALVNDNCCFYVGLTNMSSTKRQTMLNNVSKRNTILENVDKIRHIMLDRNSILNTVLAQIQHTQVEEIIIIDPDRSHNMALKVWEHIIPRISMNIVCIVFEQFDHDKLLANSSSRLIFEDLVKELMQICYLQCGKAVARFLKPEGFDARNGVEKLVSSIDFQKVVQDTKDRKRQMDMFTINEYPEFLTLSFEAYCFHHRLEYPAHVLLQQPMRLANEFGINYSSLNFLFGFYSRLLSICGYSIEGGPNELGRSSLILSIRDQLFSHSESPVVFKDVKKSPSRKWKTGLRSKLKRKSKPEHAGDDLISSSRSVVMQGSNDSSIEICEIEASDATSRNRGFQFFGSEDAADESGAEDNCDTTSAVDELIQLPKFRGRDEIDADAMFEQELRANPLTMSSRYYFDAYGLADRRSLDEKRLRPQHWNSSKFWKLQRKYLIETGQRSQPATIAGSATMPDRFLWEHLNLLRRVNMGGILSVTTSRYGHVDSSQRLFDDWSRGVGPLTKFGGDLYARRHLSNKVAPEDVD
ncbi:LAFA_0A05512g1_1 [Lachancea sp. 'fantastica']|nr:LAFA_0A05512g1_1 [Lachancea sp. 'fantastica']